MTTSRFALRNFKGRPTKFFRVESEDLNAVAPVTVKKPSHHVMILDRSGSMYYDLEPLKATLEKLLTLAEFNDDSQRVSLISYSSAGDVKLHFAKVTVADVMATSSPYLKELRSIRVTGMTCISQALKLADTLVDDGETTCISLHTDGYANHLSPWAEARDIQAAVIALKRHPALFVNTLAYNNYCDFGLMASIANQLSGKCLQVKGIKEVYAALYDTQTLLTGGTAPVVEAKVGGAEYVVFVSKSAHKILGSTTNIPVNGLSATDDKTAYRFFPIDEVTYNAMPETDDPRTALTYCRAMIADGNINAAKYALVSSKIGGLVNKHYRALVATEIAAMAADVEGALLDPGQIIVDIGPYGLPTAKATVVQVLNVLGQYPKAVMVNVPKLSKTYKRRGLKRIAGVRKEDGTLEVPSVTTIDRFPGDFLPLSSVDMNRNTATINILISRHVRLVKNLVTTENGSSFEACDEIAGIKLDNLHDFKNYTIVGDGVVCTPILPVKISDKRCFNALHALGVVPDNFDPMAEYEIDLGNLPVVDFDATFTVDRKDVERLTTLTVVSKILSAAAKESSEAYTPDQIAALKEWFLSPALYFSPPTTNDYTDLDEALSTGKVDTRLSYKVEIGALGLPSLSKLPSANAFLDRRFVLTVDGKEVPKPRMTEWLNPTAQWSVKALGPKIKLTAIDDLLFPIFEEFLQINKGANKGDFVNALFDSGAVSSDLDALFSDTKGDTTVDALSKLRKMVDEAIESFYAKTIAPLVFYVGATGLVPESLGAGPALTADDVVQLPNNTSGHGNSKDEKEGTFYCLPGGVILTVFVKSEYFTTGANDKAA
jgi:Mg-chelatase subunit ChlD